MTIMAPLPARGEVVLAKDDNDELCVLKRPVKAWHSFKDANLPPISLWEDWMQMPFYRTPFSTAAQANPNIRMKACMDLLTACHRWECLCHTNLDLKLEHLFWEQDRLIIVDAFLDPGEFASVKYASIDTMLGKGLDPSQDTFCAGMLLHEMLTGSTPYSGHRMGLLYSKKYVRPTINSQLPQGIQNVFGIALHAEMSERYHGFGQFIQDWQNA